MEVFHSRGLGDFNVRGERLICTTMTRPALRALNPKPLKPSKPKPLTRFWHPQTLLLHLSILWFRVLGFRLLLV